MSDPLIRKACDRCHHQKLSCKRNAEESCERCSKLKVDCRWSPSLRFRKGQQSQQSQKNTGQRQGQHNHQQQQQQQKQQHQQHQHQDRPQQPLQLPLVPRHGTTSTQTIVQAERRSPKRRRTGSDPNLVSPEAVPVVSQPGPGETTTTGVVTTSASPKPAQGSVATVSPGTAGLDIREFDFSFGQLEFLDPAQQQQFSHSRMPVGTEHYQQQQHPHHHHHQLHHPPPHPGLFGHWDHALTPSHNGYIDLSAVNIITTDSDIRQSNTLPLHPHTQRSRVPLHTAASTSSSRSISGTRRRARRHIALRAGRDSRQENAPRDYIDLSTPLHWMARLSEINARLQALASLLPPEYEAANGGVSHHSFPVDEMFQLTRHVADVLDQLCATAEEGEAAAAANKSGQAKLDGSDPGSAMFVLSVYVMLLDLYHRVFTLVRSEVFQQASTATFAFWKLPDVTIGSFAVESTPSLQMSLTIQLAEEFLSRLRRSTAVLDPSSRRIVTAGQSASGGGGGEGTAPAASGGGGGGSQSLFSGVVSVSFQEIKMSEDSLRQELAALRDRIEEMLEG